ncbi:MAG: hemolysin XhlA family protein [Lachnospiraceae bacterium]|nr:hemolysin XhlA family protein [Lachnospiraceae bacterium]MEE1249018.1 hemolysin XhlA family protein [Lachnospiraceae bacterium]
MKFNKEKAHIPVRKLYGYFCVRKGGTMPISEEYISKQLETTEERLNDHAERIRVLEKGVAVTDAKVNSLCERLEKQTRSINTLAGSIITALIGFFVYAVEVGVFG